MTESLELLRKDIETKWKCDDLKLSTLHHVNNLSDEVSALKERCRELEAENADFKSENAILKSMQSVWKDAVDQNAELEAITCIATSAWSGSLTGAIKHQNDSEAGQSYIDKLEQENQRLKEWQEFVRMNSKEAGYMADEYFSALRIATAEEQTPMEKACLATNPVTGERK